MPKGEEDDYRSDAQLFSLVYGRQLRSIAGLVPGLRVRARLASEHPWQMVSPVPSSVRHPSLRRHELLQDINHCVQSGAVYRSIHSPLKVFRQPHEAVG